MASTDQVKSKQAGPSNLLQTLTFFRYKLQSANKSLEDERAQQKVVVKKMFSENLKNVAQLVSR